MVQMLAESQVTVRSAGPWFWSPPPGGLRRKSNDAMLSQEDV